MSAVYLALLLPAVLAAVAVGAAALFALRALRRQVAELRVELPSAAVPAARTPEHPTATAATAATTHAADQGDAEASLSRRTEIREAVAEALAEERERELAEARAFWAAQEAREAADAPFSDARAEDGAEGPVHLSRQIDIAPLSAEARGQFEQQFTDALREAIDELVRDAEAEIDAEAEAEAAAAGQAGQTASETGAVADHTSTDAAPLIGVPDMRRHPSHPDFKPSPAVADQARTTDRLEKLAAAGTPLTDVRPGPLGTLDIYVFGDGTTLCVTPGDRTATETLADALGSGESAQLMGGSGIGGAFALTFAVGTGDDTVYVLADRVVASF